MKEDDTTSVVRMYSTRQAAEFDKMVLEGSGIDSFIRADDAGGVAPHVALISGFRLVVRNSDRERADDILKESESNSQEERIAEQTDGE